MTDFVMVRHTVTYYPHWREVFDKNQKIAHEHGFRSPYVLRDATNHNNMTLIFSLEDAHKARDFLSSDFLKESMKKAGVVVEPEITFLTDEM